MTDARNGKFSKLIASRLALCPMPGLSKDACKLDITWVAMCYVDCIHNPLITTAMVLKTSRTKALRIRYVRVVKQRIDILRDRFGGNCMP